MPRTPRLIIDNGIYHVLNRANSKEKIFSSNKDYEAFERIIVEAKKRYSMRILSFCIMPNHWHFILYPEKASDLAKFMR